MTRTAKSCQPSPLSLRTMTVTARPAPIAASVVPTNSVRMSCGERVMRRVVVTTSVTNAQVRMMPSRFQYHGAVVLIPDLIGPEEETEGREDDAEDAERTRDTALEARDSGDRRRAGDERSRERRKDLAFGAAEFAVDDRRDCDERGGGNESRRAEKENAAQRHATPLRARDPWSRGARGHGR